MSSGDTIARLSDTHGYLLPRELGLLQRITNRNSFYSILRLARSLNNNIRTNTVNQQRDKGANYSEQTCNPVSTSN
jgi:hypothetical protein